MTLASRFDEVLAWVDADDGDRYFVTELLGTDLHRLLTSRPLEKQFIQYFLYQILVRLRSLYSWLSPLTASARPEIRPLRRRRPPRPQT